MLGVFKRQKWTLKFRNHYNMLEFQSEDMHNSLYLQDVPQVGSADLRVLCGVEWDWSYPDKGKNPRFRVSPQHHPRAIICLVVEHNLMGSWKSPGSCKTTKQYQNSLT